MFVDSTERFAAQKRVAGPIPTGLEDIGPGEGVAPEDAIACQEFMTIRHRAWEGAAASPDAGITRDSLVVGHRQWLAALDWGPVRLASPSRRRVLRIDLSRLKVRRAQKIRQDCGNRRLTFSCR